MKSFLKQIETKFLELQESVDKGQDDIIRDVSDDDADNTSVSEMDSEELDEISTTGAVAGYNTPGAFTTDRKFKKKKFTWAGGQVNESNVSKKHVPGEYQIVEFDEEIQNDKFPFALDEDTWWHTEMEYPSVNLTHSPGTANKKDRDQKTKHKLGEMIDSKYEKIIESYRNFANGDSKKSPEQKVKSTIQEIAKKLQEIETLVKYNNKLKTESGVTSSTYGPSTAKALNKISERLIKISERVRSLGE
jgi:hypothetical protein